MEKIFSVLVLILAVVVLFATSVPVYYVMFNHETVIVAQSKAIKELAKEHEAFVNAINNQGAAIKHYHNIVDPVPPEPSE